MPKTHQNWDRYTINYTDIGSTAIIQYNLFIRNEAPKPILVLSVVDKSISPSETLKKGGLERLAAQWGV